MHILLPVTDKSLLESTEGKTDHRNDFMKNLSESFVAELRFELRASDSAVRSATICTMEPGPSLARNLPFLQGR